VRANAHELISGSNIIVSLTLHTYTQ
jgi:hypothetical protein